MSSAWRPWKARRLARHSGSPPRSFTTATAPRPGHDRGRRAGRVRRIQERSRSKSPGPAFTLHAAVNVLVLPSECRSRSTDVVAAARALPPASRHQGNGCTARSRCGGTVHGRAWCRQISWRYGRRATVCWRNPAHALRACVDDAVLHLADACHASTPAWAAMLAASMQSGTWQ